MLKPNKPELTQFSLKQREQWNSYYTDANMRAQQQASARPITLAPWESTKVAPKPNAQSM